MPAPDSAPHLAHHFEDLDKQSDAARLGMWLFLASEVLLFAGLFALYGAYRTMYRADFAEAAGHNNVAIGTTNTVILLTSSLTVALSVHAIREGRGARTARLLLMSIALGVAFLVLKGVEYAQHFREGIFPGVGFHFQAANTFGGRMFFTLYFLMTGLHALHVTGGLCALAWIAYRAHRGAYSAASYTPVDLAGLYWHLVDLVWIFLWPLLYLAR